MCYKFVKKTVKREETLPFDLQRAYVMHRGGIITGGGVSYSFSEEGTVKLYSRIKEAPEGEDGMRDGGAVLYFEGLRAGDVTVTVTERYPTCEDEVYSFVLTVGEDLRVTRKE